MIDSGNLKGEMLNRDMFTKGQTNGLIERHCDKIIASLFQEKLADNNKILVLDLNTGRERLIQTRLIRSST